MHKEPALTESQEQGATVVISHRVPEGRRDDYERWLDEIGPLCRSFPGHLDWQIIRPITGISGTYTVVIRFDTSEHLRAWITSAERNRLIQKVRPLLAKDDDFFIRTGLDFWFTPEEAKVKVPVRWKQFLVTWSAIYPLVLVMPLILAPVLRAAGVPERRYITTFFVTAGVVFLMAYVVMPTYTKLVRRWLFK